MSFENKLKSGGVDGDTDVNKIIKQREVFERMTPQQVRSWEQTEFDFWGQGRSGNLDLSYPGMARTSSYISGW